MRCNLRIVVLVVVLCLVLCSSLKGQTRRIPTREERAVTWQDAPELANRLRLTLVEAKQLFKGSERPNVTYATDSLPSWMKTGEPSIRGTWKLTDDYGIDRSFRSLSKTKLVNPQNLEVRSVYHYKPPKATSRMAGVRIMVHAKANSNQAEANRIKSLMESKAKSYASITTKTFDAPRGFVPDLGFGIMQNSMRYSTTSGNYVSTDIWLADPKYFAIVHIQVTMRDGAMEIERALYMARGVAVIMCNKIWGTKLKMPFGGSQGIVDLWLTSQPGQTPEEDRRDGTVEAGDTIYLAVAHYPPVIGKPVTMGFVWTPRPDAVDAHREYVREAAKRGDKAHEQVDSSFLDGLPGLLTYDADGTPKPDKDVKVKRMADGVVVAYFPLYTDDDDEFKEAPGTWRLRVLMEIASRGGIGAKRENLLSAKEVDMQVKPARSTP